MASCCKRIQGGFDSTPFFRKRNPSVPSEIGPPSVPHQSHGPPMARTPERTAETPMASSGMGDDRVSIADDHIATVHKLLFDFVNELDVGIPQVMCELSDLKVGMKMNSCYYVFQDLNSKEIDNGFKITRLSGFSPANEMDPKVYSTTLNSKNNWSEAVLSFKSYSDGKISFAGRYGKWNDFCDGEVAKSSDGRVSTYGFRKGEARHLVAHDLDYESVKESVEEIVSIAILLKNKLLINMKVQKWLFKITADAESKNSPQRPVGAESEAGGSG